MQYHEIGKTGMKVSSLSFGASSLGGVFHDLKEKEGIQAVFTAVEAGMNFIDVSPYYGHYKAETVLGKACYRKCGGEHGTFEYRFYRSDKCTRC